MKIEKLFSDNESGSVVYKSENGFFLRVKNSGEETEEVDVETVEYNYNGNWNAIATIATFWDEDGAAKSYIDFVAYSIQNRPGVSDIVENLSMIMEAHRTV